MNISETAGFFGCHDIVQLDEPTPRQLDYLDLMKPHDVSGRLKVDAVAEFQDRPLLYIVSGNQLQNFAPDKILDLQCLLANRGERAYLGILAPGELNVYPINLNRSILAKTGKKTIKQATPEAPLFFQSVVNGVFALGGQPESADYVFDTIHELMARSSEWLIKAGLDPLDVLSFLGRALFFRFLWDRKIVQPNELVSICPEAKSRSDCFGNVSNSVAICRWLDETFNGDLLPLSGDYREVFGRAERLTEGSVFLHLQAILEGWKHIGNSAFQGQIDWGELDFAHIPIGVLSQVYENFSKVWDSEESEQTSIYYTPKNIARYLVDEAFEGVADRDNVQLLDSSCGAGIFLVLAFRKLVATRWEKDQKRPDTKTIQSILYTQLCGFDISISALRLAALSLYITAIELNGSPRPPKSLKFPKPLLGVVLHNYRRPEEKDTRGFVLGSLHPDLPDDFNGRFDIIVGNPPWTRLQGKDEESKKRTRIQSKAFTSLTKRILKDRGLNTLAETYANPDNNPDLPFLWKSSEWVKPGGTIAMALPGRIFLKQTTAGTSTCSAVLQGMEITGILNGSNLSDTPVWPGMSQPFMLFFARNNIPPADHRFHFVTPHFEKQLNDKGHIRIDYQSAQAVTNKDILKHPWLLKTLAVGTSLDVELVRKLKELKWPDVKSFWTDQNLYSGLGYNRSPKLKQYDAAFMNNLPDFKPSKGNIFSIDISTLLKFKEPTLHMPRCKELYSPPLLIIPESPGSSRTSPKSWIAREPIVFSKSYYGFSARGSKQADIVIALLHLITHSALFAYYVLMTSSRMGAERRAFLKENLESFPFPIIDNLLAEQRQRVINLSFQLETANSRPLEKIDEFIFDLYGLDKYDRQVVTDTLCVAAPYKAERDRANRPPTGNERSEFYAELTQLLAPSFAITGETVTTKEIDDGKNEVYLPWRFFTIASGSISVAEIHATQNTMIARIVEEANRTGCSRAFIHGSEFLLVGILAQYRYWTRSRARLCALEILRRHLDVFPAGKN